MSWIRRLFAKKEAHQTSNLHREHQPVKADPYKLTKREIYLHEDFYLQVEVVPRENSNHLSSENDAIKVFSEEHRDGLGFTDVYVRDEQKIKTSSRNIRLDEFEELALKSGLTKLDSVYTGYGSYKEKCKDTNAYTIDGATLYCDYDNDLIKNIWIDGYRFNQESTHITTMVNSLYEIGERWNLILNDWDLSETIDLKSKEQIRVYISEM